MLKCRNLYWLPNTCLQDLLIKEDQQADLNTDLLKGISGKHDSSKNTDVQMGCVTVVVRNLHRAINVLQLQYLKLS